MALSVTYGPDTYDTISYCSVSGSREKVLLSLSLEAVKDFLNLLSWMTSAHTM